MSASQVRLNAADPRYADAVMADINRIRACAAGRALFRRLLETGTSVTIDKPLPPTEPPNAWTRLADPALPAGDTVIAYDPADWPARDRPSALSSDAILFGRLLDAIALATGSNAARDGQAQMSAELEAYLRERSPPAARATT